MTSTLAQGVGRSPGEPVRPLRALALSPALIVLLLGGLALRLTIAYVLFPASGFESDLGTYGAWAAAMAEHGPGGFYDSVSFADYPPAYLYVLWVVGLLAGPTGDPTELIKLPPILLDIAVGYVIYRLVRGWTWPGARSEMLALAAAALYLFNPVSFYDSALWGQTDAAGALVLLLGLAAVIRGNSEGAAALAAAAALVKPQFGVVLIPLVLFVLLKRHLVRPGSGPRHRPWAPRPVAGWLAREQGWLRLLTAFAAAWAAFFVVALPFGMGPLEYLERMFGTAGGYGYLTVNAYNLWALVGSEDLPSLAEAFRWVEDTIPLVGPLGGVVFGAAALVAGFAWGTLRAAARDDRWTLIVAAVVLAVAFFVLPTRVHERYIFPAIALMPLLAVVQRRWAIALLLLSVAAFINLHGILTLPLYGTQNVESLALGDLFRTQPLITFSALLQTGVFVWAAWQLRPTLRTSPDGFDHEAALGSGPATTQAALAQAPPPIPPEPVSYPMAPPAPAPGRGPDPSLGPRRIDRIVARLSWGSLRRDRGAELGAEPGGRIDRKDVLIVILLVIFTLTVRGVRLDQPARMYFDEVYHARTATEFLQHWEYGEPHDIYEFTHPHLAKYAMAWGIRLAGGNEVSGTDDLGVPVEDAAPERRWAPTGADGRRNGDRLYIGTGEALLVYDLAGLELVAELPVAATALAVDQEGHTLFVADPAGRLYRLDTTALDARNRHDAEVGASVEDFSAGPGAPVDQLLVTDTSVVAISRGSIATFDTETGLPLSERFAVAVVDAVELPWTERLVVDPRELDDRAGAATLIAEAYAGGPASIGNVLPFEGRELLEAHLDERARIAELLAIDGYVVIDAYLDDDVVSALEETITDGRLPGATVERAPLLATADDSGITVLDAWTLDVIDEIATDEPVTALALADPDGDDSTLYAASGASLIIIPVSDEGIGFPDSMWMPGDIRDLAWNEPAQLMHARGEAPEGGPTVYVVEPKGESVFIDVPLPAAASHLLADTQVDRPDADRSQLLAIAADGSVTKVGVGGNAFGWRLPGVLMGVLAAVLLFLLARVLFARRSVAVITAVLVVAEGMLLANSRIGMNDVYVTTFIVLAVLLFAPLYLAPRRPWTALAILLGVGLALGLALASKWVALYAIGGLGLLVLLRSGLGRVLALSVMISLTSVLGAMAIPLPAAGDPTRNWIFLLLMLLLTGLLAAGMVRRPIPFTHVEVLLAAAMPVMAGVALALTGRPLAGGLAIGAGVIIAVIAFIATRAGRGPFAPGAARPPGGTSAWLRPGPRYVIPWFVTLAALSVLPVGVYVLTYAPWVDLGNQWGLPLLGSLPFLPESADGGRTLAGLTDSMYQYHDNLRAEHAASSPWWAWPLDLKPVWFLSEHYSGDTWSLIYDTGNLVVFWMGIAGMGFSAWAAWRRRSLALALVVIMWAAMWLPWARVDRAAFQYHVYASLPFMLLALSYFLAELWHGPGARTWFLARAAAALAIVAVPLLWLLRTPLCILAGTAEAHPTGVACASEVTRTAQLSQGGVTAILVLAVGAGVAGYLVWRAGRAASRHPDDGGQGLWLVAVVIVALSRSAVWWPHSSSSTRPRRRGWD